MFKTKKKEGFAIGLVILAIVAITAVIGLVMLFANGITGKAVKPPALPIAVSNPSQDKPFQELPEGYIIQFTSPPTVIKLEQLKEELGLLELETGLPEPMSEPETSLPPDIAMRLQEYTATLEAEQQTGMAEIINVLKNLGISPDDLNFNQQYNVVLNGLALRVKNQVFRPEVAEAIRTVPGVKAVSPDKKVYSTLTYSVPLINADDVWNSQDALGRQLTGQGIIIAILDSGIDYTHPQFGGCTAQQFLTRNCPKVIGGYDFLHLSKDPMDDFGHGTHVASIAAGKGPDKDGDGKNCEISEGEICGVAPDAQLVIYKVLGRAGDRAGGSWSDVIAALNLAVDPNRDGNPSDHYDVISMSLGTPKGHPDDHISIAADNAMKAGAVVVIAAGNTGPDFYTIASPGTARKPITVGASDKDDKVPSRSSRGPTPIGTIKPDVVAPGSEICAAAAGKGNIVGPCGTGLIAKSGTSMATPHVAGLAALLKQKNPTWTPAEIKMAVRNTAKKLGFAYNAQGWGRADALAAIQSPRPCKAEIDPVVGRFEGQGSLPIGKSFDMKGTATCPNFQKYQISFAPLNKKTYSVSQWTAIMESSSSVNRGLLTNWDTTYVKPASYLLRLEVFDTAGSKSEDVIMVRVGRK